MMDCERKVAGLRLRLWGLLALFFSNALGLYGMARKMAGEGGDVAIAAGVILTLLLLMLLSVPDRGP